MKSSSDPSRLAAAARLAAVPVAALGLGTVAWAPVADAAPTAINGNSYDLATLDYGVYLDLDGDGQNDFFVEYFQGFEDIGYGDQIVIQPLGQTLLSLQSGDAASVITPNTIVAEREGSSPSFGSSPTAVAFNNGEYLRSFSTPPETAAYILDGLYDANGVPDTGLFLGNFLAEDSSAVLYDSLTYTDLLDVGNDFLVVFDIPGGSPYVATLDFIANFQDDAFNGFIVGSNSNYVALPEPGIAAIAAIAPLLTLRRRHS
jgi:hypothetical protein